MKKIISKPDLLENAKKIREREKQKLNTQLRELQQIPVRRYSNGEYIPLNYNDLELIEWCRKFNRKLRNCKVLMAQQITPIRLCGIQSGLQQYDPYNRKDKRLCEWCRIKNKEIITKKISEPIRKPISIIDGKYKPYDETDTLLAAWCDKYNKKLYDSKKFISKHTGIQIWLSGDYFACSGTQSQLKKWCQKRNSEIKKILSKRDGLNGKA